MYSTVAPHVHSEVVTFGTFDGLSDGSSVIILRKEESEKDTSRTLPETQRGVKDSPETLLRKEVKPERKTSPNKTPPFNTRMFRGGSQRCFKAVSDLLPG